MRGSAVDPAQGKSNGVPVPRVGNRNVAKVAIFTLATASAGVVVPPALLGGASSQDCSASGSMRGNVVGSWLRSPSLWSSRVGCTWVGVQRDATGCRDRLMTVLRPVCHGSGARGAVGSEAADGRCSITRVCDLGCPPRCRRYDRSTLQMCYQST